MVRWSDGFYGGLLAAVISAIFYAIVSVVTRGSVGIFYGDIARALPPLRGTPDGAATFIVGAIVYLLVAIVMGIVYALLAGRIRSMLHAPTSVMWGMFYGLLTWMPSYLHKTYGFNIATTGGATFVIFMSGFVGELIGGTIGDRWKASGASPNLVMRTMFGGS